MKLMSLRGRHDDRQEAVCCPSAF